MHKDISKMSTAEHMAVIQTLSRLPLRELRKRQDITAMQLLIADHEDDMRNLQVKELHLQHAIDLKAFPPSKRKK